MAGLPQVRGMLLEEVILHFLGANGYVAIDEADRDPTLSDGPSGLRVRGRGTLHQIDAIANYRFTPPFSHPYRLLVEAKSLDGSVGLGVIRNALGVLRDVNEYWRGQEEPRFHYQYAVFTDTCFTKPAQSFGYVQDIFLLPLAKATSMANVLTALRGISADDLPPLAAHRALASLRREFRTALGTGAPVQDELAFAKLLIDAARQVRQALIGMTLNGLPLFLVPARDVDVTTLSDQVVRIAWDDDSWYVNSQAGARLFSFDLPEQLFDRYVKRGNMTSRSALNLKKEAFEEIQATVFDGPNARVVRFVLDQGWVERVRVRIRERRQPGLG